MLTNKIKLIVIPVVVVIVAAVALYLYLSFKKSPGFFTPAAPQPAASRAAQAETLGGKIYEGASNPIQGKVPTVNPVTNPVQGLYKNPFQ